MINFWNNLSKGQGAFLSGALTAIGAVIAVLLAQKFFGNRVSSLKDGVEQTEKTIKEFEASFEEKIASIADTFNETFSGIERSLATTQAAIYEGQRDSEDEDEHVDAGGEEDQHDARGRVADYWHKIRDKLEEIASSPNIDGRTRAKYSRIDRRSYYDLVNALESDGHIVDAHTANTATYLWYSCRRKEEVAEECAANMEGYWGEVSKWEMP